jgi:hypothetical protein
VNYKWHLSCRLPTGICPPTGIWIGAPAYVRFAGPDIVYDPASDSFVASSARAIGDDQPHAVVDDDHIFKLVCHMAAGGVALRLAGIAEAAAAA